MKMLDRTPSKPLFRFRPLPLFVNYDNKYFVGLILAFIAIGLYLPSNHFHFSEPKLLPFSWIDLATPFIPETIWIYLSEYLFFVTVYVSCKDIINLNKYFYSFVTIQTFSVLIFYIWPTTYPRDLFPLPHYLDAVTYHAFRYLRITDTPANCCPSLHVSSVYLSSLIFFEDNRKKFFFFFLWGTAIALSTLTTKQHYLIDLIAGLGLALLFHWIFHRKVQYQFREPKRNDSKSPRTSQRGG